MLTTFFLKQVLKFLLKKAISPSSLNVGEDEILRGINAKHQLDTYLKNNGIDPESFYSEMEKYMQTPAFQNDLNFVYCKDKPCWQQGN
jgi:hypothetical protein